MYGIKKEKKVTEDLSLIPISLYNKTKMTAERVLLSYSKFMKTHKATAELLATSSCCARLRELVQSVGCELPLRVWPFQY